MPIYEYICQNCSQTEEIIQKVDGIPPDHCTHCHCAGSLKKTVSASAFHLRGGGWYKDLYSSKKPTENKSSNQSDTCKNTCSSDIKNSNAS